MAGIYDPFDTSYAPTLEELQQMQGDSFGAIGQAGPMLDYQPAQPAVAPPRQRILFNQTAGQIAAGGVTFDARDIESLVRVPEFLQQPQAPDPEGGEWQEVTPSELQGYLESLAERRGFLSNVGLGIRQTGQGLVGGAGHGLRMMGHEGAGETFIAAGDAIGPDEYEQQRSALIRQNSTLFENILDAAAQGVPSFAASVAGGGLGAAAVLGAARVGGVAASSGALSIGAFTGSAAVIFPMELQSSVEAALANNYDINDPEVNTEILGSAIGKTLVQTLAPAMVARGFSSALTGRLNDAGQRLARNRIEQVLTSRIAKGAGIGLTEAMAEGLAEIIDAATFDPEFRRQLNASDWKALGPYIVEQYGEDALIAAGAGFLLGGGLGTAASRSKFTGIVEDTGPRDLLGDPPSPDTPPPGPEGLPAPEGPAGLLPPPPPAPVGALPAPPAALAAPDRSAAAAPEIIVPPVDPTAQPPISAAPPPVAPAQPPAAQAPPAPVAPRAVDIGLSGPVAQGFDQAAAAPAPVAPPTPQQFTAAPPDATGETAIGAQLNRLRQQVAAQQATAQQAAEAQARRDAERTAAEEQRAQEAAAQEVTVDQFVDAVAEWDRMRDEAGRLDGPVTLSRLTQPAQREWVLATREGFADRALFEQLYRRRALREDPLVRPERRRAEQPEVEPRGLTQDAIQATPGEAAQLAAQASRPAQRGREALRRGRRHTDAVQEPSPAPRAVRQEPAARREIRARDTQGQEAARARAQEGEQAQPAVQAVTPAAAEPPARPARQQRQRAAEEDTTAINRVTTDEFMSDPEVSATVEQVTSVPEESMGRQKVSAGVTLMTWAADPATSDAQRAMIEQVLTSHFATEAQMKALRSAFGRQAQAESLTSSAEEAATLDATAELAQMIEDFNAAPAEMTRGFQTRFKELIDAVKADNPEARISGPQSHRLLDFADSRGFPRMSRGKIAADPKAMSGRFSIADFNGGTEMVGLNNQPLGPMPVGRVRMVTRNFLNRFAVQPRVSLFANQADMRQKAPDLYARAKAARSQGDFDATTAAAYFFDGDQVIVFTDNIYTTEQLRTVIAHETLGHMGLRAVVPESELNAVMDSIYDADEALRVDVDRAMDARGLSKAEAVEEYLSDFAARIDGSLLTRWWNAVKSALNKLGLRFGDEHARYLMNQSRRYTRTGQRSSFFDAEQMGRGVNRMNLGQDPAGTGRFARADVGKSPLGISRMVAQLAGERPSIYEAVTDLREAIGRGQDLLTNAADRWDQFKAAAFTPTQWRAMRNEGFQRVFELVRRRHQIASSVVDVAQEMRKTSLRPRSEAASRLGVTSGISKKELTNVGRALMTNRIIKTRAFQPSRAVMGEKLFHFNRTTGTLTPNTQLFESLKAQGRLSREAFERGVEVRMSETVTMDAAEQRRLTEERDQMLAQTTDEDAAKMIRSEYDGRIRANTYEREYTETFRHKFTDLEWQAFTEDMDTVAHVAMQRLESILSRYNEERGSSFDIIQGYMEGALTRADRTMLDRVVQTYFDTAYANVEFNEDGTRVATSIDIGAAETFAEQFNKVLLGAAKIETLFGESGYFPDSDQATLTQQIEGFKSRLRLPKRTGDNAKDQPRFVVQNQVRSLAHELLATTEAERSTIRTLATGYTPFIREGSFEMRISAQDENGNVYPMAQSFRDQMVYMQFPNRAAARHASELAGSLFGEGTVNVEVWDATAEGGAGAFVNKQLKLVPTVGAVRETATSDPEINLNESMRFLRRFGIQLNPQKTEQVIIALTNQNDRAILRQLRAAFTPGASADMTKAISQHIETMASVIARNKTAVELGNTLDINRSRSLWYGEQAEYDRRKRAYERLQGAEGVNEDALSIAKQEFDEYHNWFVTNNAPENGVRSYNEARRLVTFLDQQKQVMETDIAAKPVASMARFLTSVSMLGGSIATGALNLFGLMTNVPGALMSPPDAGFGGGFDGFSVMAELARATKIVGLKGLVPGVGSDLGRAAYWRGLKPKELKRLGMTQAEANFLAEGIERGDFRAAQFDALRGSARGRITSGSAQRLVDGYMFFFNSTEQASRRITALASYRMDYRRRINAGWSHTDADAAAKTFAYRVTNMTLGDYTTANRPQVFRGGLLQFAFMFKQFPVNSIALLANMPRKGKIYMIGSLMALSGLRGMPFAEDLEDLIDTISQKLGFTKASIRAEVIQAFDEIVPGLGRIVAGGLVNQFIEGDLGVRTALGDIVPGSGMFLAGADRSRELLQVMGPIASTVESSLGTLDNLLNIAGGGKPGDWSTLLRNTPFTIGNAWSDAYAYHQNGAIVDKRGYVVSEEYNAGMMLMRLMGFYPNSASRQYETVRLGRRISEYQKSMSGAFRDAAVRARAQGDHAEVRRIFGLVRDWNRNARGSGLEISNFAQKVNQATKAQRQLASERFLNSTPLTARRRIRELVEAYAD